MFSGDWCLSTFQPDARKALGKNILGFERLLDKAARIMLQEESKPIGIPA
jgi:hypothetical protein